MTVANAMNFFFASNPNKVVKATVTSKNGQARSYFTKENFNAEKFAEFSDYNVIAISYNQNNDTTYQIPSFTIFCEKP